MPAGYELSDEQWEAHVREIIKIGEEGNTTNEEVRPNGQIDMSWAVVFVRLAKVIYYVGPRESPTNILHVSNPNRYANVREATSATNDDVETILPTEDEDEIRRWKLVPCSARLQYANAWVRFRCKLLEYKGYPEVCVVVAKSDNVIDCTIYRMADDENDNRLLWVKMKALLSGAPVDVEMCCKKIVGDEVTVLSDDELKYVQEEEYMRFWD